MMIKNKALWVSLSLAAVTWFPLSAVADDDDHDEDSGWEFEIQAGFQREPTYVGSDRYITEPGFNIEATYESQNGHQYSIGLGEVGAFFNLSNGWFLGTALEYEPGRDNSEDPILSAFPEVESTVEGQFTLAKKMGDWTVAGVYQPDVLDRGKGNVYFMALEYEHEFNSRLSLGTTLDISFADKEHMNTEVGISNDVARASGLSAYEADSGFKSTTLSFEVGYQMTENWKLISDFEAEFYGSNISDSPLVKDHGSDINYAVGIGIQYSF